MDVQFTAVFRRVAEGYIGFVEEAPGVNTQELNTSKTRGNRSVVRIADHRVIERAEDLSG
jgi:hypothetical protein